MARVERKVPAPPEKVYKVLADGWTYSDWVVGTAHIRDVDSDWPAPGSRIHHRVGIWPFYLADQTVAVEHEVNSRIVMRPRLWPLGGMVVTIELAPVAGGTRITLEEDIEEGPLRGVRTKINDLALHWRNVESLRRLGDLAARRGTTTPSAP